MRVPGCREGEGDSDLDLSGAGRGQRGPCDRGGAGTQDDDDNASLNGSFFGGLVSILNF